MSLRWRRPPAREWVPMSIGLSVALVGAALLLTRAGSATGWLLIVLGGAFFYGVVAHRMATARADE